FEAFWGADEVPQAVRAQQGWRWWRERRWRDEMRTHRAGLLPLARNPYLLLMLVAVQESSGGLPQNRGALFEMFAETLLLREGLASRTDAGEVLVNAEGQGLLAALTTLAFTMQAQRGEAGEREQQAVTALGREVVFPALLSERQGYLARCATLLEGEGTIRFSHQLLQEYFAARYMKVELEAGRLPAEAIWQRTEPGKRTGWEEATVLLAGLYSDDCTRVLEWVEGVNPEVAAACLVRSGAGVNAETRARLQAAWLQRLTDVEAEPDPRVRAAVGRALAVAGLDNRRGVGIGADGLPDILWVEIPGGKCQLGGDEDAYDDLPAQEVEVPIFWLAKYPVTNWQWAAFVADGGYETDEWWAGLEKPKPDDPSWTYGNHPRETVDWHEATAYCRWLRARLGYEVRLPSEEEWEKAARGTAGRIFPWGDEYVSGYANISETWSNQKVGPYYLQQTSAVGLYPQGATPEGVLDLSGNVEEWCLTNVKSGSPVLRGGSWSPYAQNARAASRNHFLPALRLSYGGFRVVRPAPAVL
ncbi:MAG: SUMF1/EgtB/PvdO family nonheme iron enzyme, partial [Ardenticatenales bacterium]|nr:SUMF1/EgtB/PvdO family nonheme iron enzyme [Ardenticatenales bacterium]